MSETSGLRLPPLPCPECTLKGRPTRIGNRRSTCRTCNNFAQSVLRHTASRLKARHKDEFTALRFQVEVDLYPQVIEDFKVKQERRR